ncbi:MAG: hypothetical protein ACERKO_13480, partial [Acetanaerobacterium sp.]
ELNACVEIYNEQQHAKGKEQLTVCWYTANFTGAAFAGKLKPLKRYIKDDSKTTAPKVDKEEFERRLKAAEERRVERGIKKA